MDIFPRTEKASNVICTFNALIPLQPLVSLAIYSLISFTMTSQCLVAAILMTAAPDIPLLSEYKIAYK